MSHLLLPCSYLPGDFQLALLIAVPPLITVTVPSLRTLIPLLLVIDTCNAQYSHMFATRGSDDPADRNLTAYGADGVDKPLRQGESEFLRVQLLLGSVVQMDRDSDGMKERIGGRLNGYPNVKGMIAPVCRILVDATIESYGYVADVYADACC